MVTRPVIVAVGSCVTRTVLEALGTFRGLTEQYEMHASIEVPGGRPLVPEAMLARCALLIEQHYPLNSSAAFSAEERSRLPADCATVRLPLVSFSSLWPFVCIDPRDEVRPGYRWGRYMPPCNDSLALSLLKRGLSAAALVAAYHATDVSTVVDLARFHEIQGEQMIENERTCDIRIAAFVLTHFRLERLFLMNHHPGPALLLYILAQLLAHPRFDRFRCGSIEAMLRSLSAAWLAQPLSFFDYDVPINPQVARFFELAWWSPDLVYHPEGQPRTFDEWLVEYTSEPLPLPTA